MPDIQSSLGYLADIALYDVEKPYYALLSPELHRGNNRRLNNLEWETHDNISITDMRDHVDDVGLEKTGFQFISHTTKFLKFEHEEDTQQYQRETEALLCELLGGVYARCYEIRIRKNQPIDRDVCNLSDPLLVEGPAIGAHIDVTFDSGPKIIERHLSDEDKARFLKPGYRFRIVNTWRPLVHPSLEDCPLALCDYRSVNRNDLVAADRIIPNRVGEVYYLKYNEKQRWYWLENQTPDEPFMMVMYDTKPGNHARYCPHVSFPNPRAPANAQKRHSIETRSVVISKTE